MSASDNLYRLRSDIRETIRSSVLTGHLSSAGNVRCTDFLSCTLCPLQLKSLNDWLISWRNLIGFRIIPIEVLLRSKCIFLWMSILRARGLDVSVNNTFLLRTGSTPGKTSFNSTLVLAFWSFPKWAEVGEKI